MDDELFAALYHIVNHLWPGREKRVQFSESTIMLMHLWCVMRGKPRGWVCDVRNQPALLRQRPTPSPSRW